MTSEDLHAAMTALFDMRAELDAHANCPPSDSEIDASAERLSIRENLKLDDDLPDTVDDLIVWLQVKRLLVPEDLRHTLTFEVDAESDYDGPPVATYCFYYERPESDEEWAARKEDVERRAALHVRARDNAEREAYERLRAKFEDVK